MAAEDQHGRAAGAGARESAARNEGLRRKLGHVRPPGPGVMTPAKALALALPKAAEEGFSLTLVQRGIEERRHLLPAALLEWLSGFAEGGGDGGDGGSGGEAGENSPEDDGAHTPLILALERSDGLRAYALPDPQLTAALIEVQTLGTVLPRPAEPRPPTLTDGAMCAPFIERVLEKFEIALAAQTLPYWAGGYRVGERISSLRHLEMMLEEIPHRLYSMEMDLGEGAKRGRLVLVFADLAAPPEAAGPEGADWHALFTSQVLESRAELVAVLGRIGMPIRALRALKAGDMLKMPIGVIGAVALEEPSGRVLARCRLGQKGGQKALRIEPPDAHEANAAAPAEGRGFGAGGQMADASAMGLDALAGGPAAENAGMIGGGVMGGGMADAGLADAGPAGQGLAGAGASPLDMQGRAPGGDLPQPDASASADLPPLGDALASGDLPPLGDIASAGAQGGGGDLPPLGEMGELPPLGDLPAEG